MLRRSAHPNLCKHMLFGLGEWIRRTARKVEFLTVRAAGRHIGIHIVVRYFRRADPLLVGPLLRTFGASVGAGTTFKCTLYLDNVAAEATGRTAFRNLRIGRNCYIGDCVYFDLAGEVTIADNSSIAGAVAFLTHADCNRSPELNRVFPRRVAPVTVSTGSWIGYGVTIMPGAAVGPNTAVAARSLIKGEVAGGAVHAGSPARLLRYLDIPRETLHPSVDGKDKS